MAQQASLDEWAQQASLDELAQEASLDEWAQQASLEYLVLALASVVMCMRKSPPSELRSVRLMIVEVFGQCSQPLPSVLIMGPCSWAVVSVPSDLTKWKVCNSSLVVGYVRATALEAAACCWQTA